MIGIPYLLSSAACVLAARSIPVLYSGSHTGKIRDFFHEFFPKLHLDYLSDIMILAQIVLAVVISDITRVIQAMTIIQVMRVICAVTTVLPPLKHYKDKYRLGGLNGSGTEYIFSGHASYAALTFLSLWEAGVPIQLLVFYNILSQMCIILSRNHYTVDVVLAWIIAPLVYLNLSLRQRCGFPSYF